MAADPIISEFSASNDDAIRDGFGASSDWIEIYNAGDEGVDLAGYRLTDNLSNLSKWVFPSVTLAPGAFLVVFASGNGEPDPSGYLHTNFALAAAGEQLALVDPQGTILSQYGSPGNMYPPQPADDDSHGIAFDRFAYQVISPTSGAKFHIPTSSSVDAHWMLPEFDDSSWTSSTASVGYEFPAGLYTPAIGMSLPVGTTTAYLRIPFEVAEAGSLIERLELQYDDGFVLWLNGEEIARSNAPAQLGYSSVATTLRVQEAALQKAPIDVLAHSDHLVAGTNLLAVQILNFGADKDLLFAPHMTVVAGAPSSPGDEGPLLYPTPGLPNGPVRAGDVEFSRVGGAIMAPFELVLSSPSAGDVIRYTSDGTIPTLDSPVYSGPITLSASTQIRARAFGPAGRVGDVRSEAYTRVDAIHADFNSNLPIVVLENFGQGLIGREFHDSYFSLYDVDPVTGRSDFSGEPDVTTRAAQHRRGTTSFQWPKYSLRIELRDEAGNDKDFDLLGMPAESDWILYGPYSTDRSLIRNPLWYDLSAQLGNYSVKTHYVEVFSNHDGGGLDSSDYMGVYALIETIKVDADRLDIEKLDPTDNTAPDITGGYLFKIDREVSEEDADWNTPRGTPHNTPVFVHVSPERWELTTEQTNYLRNYIVQFENALYGPYFRHPELGYAAYIDVDSFVDHFLVRTFSKEKDGLVLSEHYSKDRNGKITMGPVWDFDLSSGYADDLTRGPEGWSWRSEERPWYGTWFGRLFEDAAFIQRVIDRWQELRTSVFSDQNLIATVERHASDVSEAQARNYLRWPESLNKGGLWADPGLTGWEAAISNLQNWLLLRADWIDQQMPIPPLLSATQGEDPNKVEISLETLGESGAIYYTLDGSEPFDANWQIAPGAQLYTGPFSVVKGTELIARVRDTSTYWRWSSPVGGLLTLAGPATNENLRLTELHYHPANPTAAELAALPGVVDNEFEFLELTNTSPEWVSLAGLQFTSGIEFSFAGSPVEQLAPGASLVLVSNRQAFEFRYGTGIPIAGEYTGQLGNSDDQITLVGPLGEEIFHISYLDTTPWPVAPDGDGPSLEILDPRLAVGLAHHWRASRLPHGTPGVATRWGDYDESGTVDTDDYGLWKSSYGDSVAPFTGADANGDGKVDMADFIAWRNSLGESIPAAAALAVVLPQNDPSPPVEALASLPAPLFPGRGEANRRGTFIDEGSSYRDGVAADDPLLLLGIRSPGEEEPREEWLPQAGVKESSSEQPARQEAFAVEFDWLAVDWGFGEG